MKQSFLSSALSMFGRGKKEEMCAVWCRADCPASSRRSVVCLCDYK